eukprot:Pgem_evm1s143
MCFYTGFCYWLQKVMIAFILISFLIASGRAETKENSILILVFILFLILISLLITKKAVNEFPGEQLALRVFLFNEWFELNNREGT